MSQQRRFKKMKPERKFQEGNIKSYRGVSNIPRRPYTHPCCHMQDLKESTPGLLDLASCILRPLRYLESPACCQAEMPRASRLSFPWSQRPAHQNTQTDECFHDNFIQKSYSYSIWNLETLPVRSARMQCSQ